MVISARLIAVLAVALLPAMPAAAQAVQSVKVGGHVAPRCFAAAPAAVRLGGSQGAATVRCNSSRPGIALATRQSPQLRQARAAGNEPLFASDSGQVVFDMPQSGSRGGALEIVVSPAA